MNIRMKLTNAMFQSLVRIAQVMYNIAPMLPSITLYGTSRNALEIAPAIVTNKAIHLIVLLIVEDLINIRIDVQYTFVTCDHIFEIEFKEHFDIINIGIFLGPWGLENGITKPIWIWFPFSYIINNVSHKLW